MPTLHFHPILPNRATNIQPDVTSASRTPVSTSRQTVRRMCRCWTFSPATGICC